MDALLGYSTVALAVGTFALAGVATWQARLSHRALQQQIDITDREFQFESVRQTFAAAPMVVVELSEERTRMDSYGHPVGIERSRLILANRGIGPAINVRFSCLVNGKQHYVAETPVAPLGINGVFDTDIEVAPDGAQAFHVNELVIRYNDVFGNLYASEYSLVSEKGGWHEWKRPWVGMEFGYARPTQCSEDPPEWGYQGREQYQQAQGGEWIR